MPDPAAVPFHRGFALSPLYLIWFWVCSRVAVVCHRYRGAKPGLNPIPPCGPGSCQRGLVCVLGRGHPQGSAVTPHFPLLIGPLVSVTKVWAGLTGKYDINRQQGLLLSDDVPSSCGVGVRFTTRGLTAAPSESRGSHGDSVACHRRVWEAVDPVCLSINVFSRFNTHAVKLFI